MHIRDVGDQVALCEQIELLRRLGYGELLDHLSAGIIRPNQLAKRMKIGVREVGCMLEQMRSLLEGKAAWPITSTPGSSRGFSNATASGGFTTAAALPPACI